MTIWNELEHFNRDENWGDPDKMNGALLLLANALRDFIDERCVVHRGFATSGHSPKSQHYAGNAFDYHFDSGYSFKMQIDQMLDALSYFQVDDRVGLGIYPEWYHPGFHLDLRGCRARWGRVKGIYVSFAEAYKVAEEMENEEVK